MSFFMHQSIEYTNFCPKKHKKIKNENSCFPQGGFEPTTLGFEDRRYTTELKIQD